MMGRLTAGQAQFFYAFHLDEVVPADHVVRRIDAVLDLGWIHKELTGSFGELSITKNAEREIILGGVTKDGGMGRGLGPGRLLKVDLIPRNRGSA